MIKLDTSSISRAIQNLTAMPKLDKSLNFMLSRNKEGSFSTHVNRSLRLNQSIKQLSERYKDLHSINDLKSRHISYLVDKWKNENLSSGTIKNRMSDLRWLAHKINKDNIVHRSNRDYDIADRVYVKNDTNTAKILTQNDLNKINDEYSRYSLRLQQEFGLRREESIKFNPNFADKGDKIELKATWCKGGRARDVPILTDNQRKLINEIKAFCKKEGAEALIPPKSAYKNQLQAYKNQIERAEIMKNHGLRHGYAQARYKQLTGNECPKNGGKTWRELTSEERQLDKQARLLISSELGHNREEITAVYLGR